MKYKEKKNKIAQKFKDNSKEEIYDKLEELGFDAYCNKYGASKCNVQGNVLSEIYLTHRSKIDQRMYPTWKANYSKSCEFNEFKNYCLSMNYTITSGVRRIDCKEPHSLANIRISNVPTVNTDLEKKLLSIWRNRHQYVEFDVFVDYIMNLNYDKDCLIFKIDTNKPHSLENIRIHQQFKQGNLKYNLLKKNHKLLHSNIGLNELTEIALNSKVYEELEYPFITKDLNIIDLKDSHLTLAQQSQMSRKISIKNMNGLDEDNKKLLMETLVFEYKLTYDVKDLKALEDYVSFCVNNHQENPKEYVEKHHILMSRLFLNYNSFKENPWNQAVLNKKDHIEAHRLLHIALNMRATMDAYNLALGCSNEDGEYVGKPVIIFDYLGNEIDRFPTRKLAESKYGYLDMLHKSCDFFDIKNPKIAIYEDDFTEIKLQEYINGIKPKIVHVKNLETKEVHEFSSAFLARKKYPKLRNFVNTTSDKKFVAYYPHRESHKGRAEKAQNLYDSRITKNIQQEKSSKKVL